MSGFEKWVGAYEPNIPKTEEITLVDLESAMKAAWQESAKQERKRLVGIIRNESAGMRVWETHHFGIKGESQGVSHALKALADRIETNCP